MLLLEYWIQLKGFKGKDVYVNIHMHTRIIGMEIAPRESLKDSD